MRANSAEMMGNVANQRADNAEREAAAANARVDLPRAAAPVAAPQTTTTVVTEHDTSAVSYTHLDVYKRQHFSSR